MFWSSGFNRSQVNRPEKLTKSLFERPFLCQFKWVVAWCNFQSFCGCRFGHFTVFLTLTWRICEEKFRRCPMTFDKTVFWLFRESCDIFVPQTMKKDLQAFFAMDLSAGHQVYCCHGCTVSLLSSASNFFLENASRKQENEWNCLKRSLVGRRLFLMSSCALRCILWNNCGRWWRIYVLYSVVCFWDVIFALLFLWNKFHSIYWFVCDLSGFETSDHL